jgi:drug/metabolite transporter (DMT)-like permease
MLRCAVGRHPLFLPYLALAAVCLFWGTTYLAIRMSLEAFSPLAVVSIRYTLAGAAMLAIARVRGMQVPRGADLAMACVTGLLTLGIGNGALVYAELLVPSGMASLILTFTPFWMVAIEALFPGGERLHGPTLAGMVIGLAGAALLFVPGDAIRASDLLRGFLLLQFCMFGWALGSILQRRRPGAAHPAIAGGVQMLATGLAAAPFALLIRDHPSRWSTRSFSAVLYLVVFGSIVGYSAYMYALDRLPVAIASVYTYVNVVVAMALGWLVYREPFAWRETLAMLVIFTGVWVVKRYSVEKRLAPSAEPAVPAARVSKSN